METTTEPKNDSIQISQHSTALFRWIGEQLTVLAEAFGEFLTPARLKVYADNLSDLERVQLAEAFWRAARELKYFPKIAELRQFAGVDTKLQTHLEAEQAWQQVELDLANRGRDAPAGLTDRIEYAIRAAGGRRAINASFSDSVTHEQFTKKAFVEAFGNYEAAERLGLHQIPASVRQLLTPAAEDRQDRPKLKLLPGSKPSAAPAWKPAAKPIPRPLSDDEVEARRALLAEQARKLRASG